MAERNLADGVPEPASLRHGLVPAWRKRRKDSDIVERGTRNYGHSFCRLQPQPGGITLFLPLILIMVVFYFLMIMPAQKRQKKITADAEKFEEWRQSHHQRRHLWNDRRA